jgi:type IV pilus assembly protein PilM
MVGVQSSVISKYQGIVEKAGLNIISIETEILSVIRSLVYNKDENIKKNFPHTVIMNIGAVNTSLAIIKEGLLIYNYSIPIGGSAINRALEADFGLTESASEEYKKVYGISKEGVGGKIGGTIQPILVSILNDLKKALAFYTQKYQNNNAIQQIMLCGGTAKLPGIQLFFAESLGIETAIANPWQVLANQNLPKEMLDNASDYTVAVGLAMRSYE